MRAPSFLVLPFASSLALLLTPASLRAAEPDPAARAATDIVLVPPPVVGGLTAAQAAAKAAASSRTARARAEAKAAADAAVAQTRAAYVPHLSGVARYTRLSSLDQPSLGTLVVAPDASPGPLPANAPLSATPLSFPVILDQYTAQATLQIPLSDYLWRLPRASAAATDSAKAAAQLEMAARTQAAADARVTYYSWARAKLAAQVTEQTLSQARAHLVDVRHASESGTASRADVLRVESQVAAAELAVARATSAVIVVETRLRTAMHDDSAQPLDIGEDLRATPAPSDYASARASDLLTQALDRRPEVKALTNSAGAARAQAQATRAAGLPRLDAVGNATYARPNARIFPQKDEFRGTWDASLQVSWAPTDLFGTEAGQRQAEARARELDAERESLVDNIAIEISQALASLHEADTAVASSTRGLAAASESYRVRRTLFQNGRATSVELTDAETELYRAQLESIGAALDRRIADVRLQHAVGHDLAAAK